MAKEVQIWARDNEDAGMVVYPDDVEQKYNLYGCSYIKFPSVAADEAQGLIKKLNQALSELDGYLVIDDVEDFLQDNGITARYEHCNDEENTVNYPVLAFDNHEHDFFDLCNCNEMDVYRYWDGSNWKTIWAEDCSITSFEISENKVCLDEWDGRNLVTGGVGLHEYVYKVYQENGGKVEDTYLVVYSSQYQGVQDTANVMTEEELQKHLKEINRDEDYIDLCKAIEA